MYLLFLFVLEMYLSLVVYLYSVLEVFSAWRSKNQFLFMFIGCVKCCTFLFIDVTVGRFVLLFVLCFRFCFQMLRCIKKGYYVLEFVIGIENRDNMTKELSLIFLFMALFCMIIFCYTGYKSRIPF